MTIRCENMRHINSIFTEVVTQEIHSSVGLMHVYFRIDG